MFAISRREMMLSAIGGAAVGQTAKAQRPEARREGEPTSLQSGGPTPDKLLLKDYRPRSIYKIPITDIKKARFPIIDVHCHGPRVPQTVDQMVQLMDSVG